jgi:hypothetical protein
LRVIVRISLCCRWSSVYRPPPTWAAMPGSSRKLPIRKMWRLFGMPWACASLSDSVRTPGE